MFDVTVCCTCTLAPDKKYVNEFMLNTPDMDVYVHNGTCLDVSSLSVVNYRSQGASAASLYIRCFRTVLAYRFTGMPSYRMYDTILSHAPSYPLYVPSYPKVSYYVYHLTIPIYLCYYAYYVTMLPGAGATQQPKA